jgi:hypothetical protein
MYLLIIQDFFVIILIREHKKFLKGSSEMKMGKAIISSKTNQLFTKRKKDKTSA